MHVQASIVSVSSVRHTAHCGTESEHQAFNGSHIFIYLRKYWYYLKKILALPRTGGSLGCAPSCDAGGRESETYRTNTQGL